MFATTAKAFVEMTERCIGRRHRRVISRQETGAAPAIQNGNGSPVCSRTMWLADHSDQCHVRADPLHMN
jgi:hypothetical protein